MSVIWKLAGRREKSTYNKFLTKWTYLESEKVAISVTELPQKDNDWRLNDVSAVDTTFHAIT